MTTTKVINNSQKYKQSYIDYLQTLPWTYYFTGSTRYELTLKSNRRLMEYFYEAIKVPDSMLFHVAEKFECKDGYHGHGLLYLPNKYGSLDPDNKYLWRQLIDTWQLLAGNKAISNDQGKITWDKAGWASLNLKRYDPKRGAGGYCAKYIFKSDADYDLLTYQEPGEDLYTNYNYRYTGVDLSEKVPLNHLNHSYK